MPTKSMDLPMPQGIPMPPQCRPRVRVYIAGPMTGLPDHNYPAFFAEARRLRALGFAVANPAEFNPQYTPRPQCMRNDLLAILRCGAITYLPGWENSAGAKLENMVATEIGLLVLPYGADKLP